MDEKNTTELKNSPPITPVESTTVPIPATPPPATNIIGGNPDVKTEGELPAEVQIAISNAIVKVKDSLTANFVTILGIFASFITFLGIEIQILKNFCDYWRILGFSFFILTAVITFVFAIYIFINHEDEKGWQKILGMCIVIAVLLGGAFYSLSKSKDEYICKLTQLNDRFEELNIQYSKNNNLILDSLQKRVNALEGKIK
jgi:hypothetical protein